MIYELLGHSFLVTVTIRTVSNAVEYKQSHKHKHAHLFVPLSNETKGLTKRLKSADTTKSNINTTPPNIKALTFPTESVIMKV